MNIRFFLSCLILKAQHGHKSITPDVLVESKNKNVFDELSRAQQGQKSVHFELNFIG